MADTRLLLKRLEEYRHSLRRHVIALRSEYEYLDVQWQRLSVVYQGDAADQFRAYWIRTADRFQEYITNTDRIAEILDERIEALREANREEGMLR